MARTSGPSRSKRSSRSEQPSACQEAWQRSQYQAEHVQSTIKLPLDESTLSDSSLGTQAVCVAASRGTGSSAKDAVGTSTSQSTILYGAPPSAHTGPCKLAPAARQLPSSMQMQHGPAVELTRIAYTSVAAHAPGMQLPAPTPSHTASADTATNSAWVRPLTWNEFQRAAKGLYTKAEQSKLWKEYKQTRQLPAGMARPGEKPATSSPRRQLRRVSDASYESVCSAEHGFDVGGEVTSKVIIDMTPVSSHSHVQPTHAVPLTPASHTARDLDKQAAEASQRYVQVCSTMNNGTETSVYVQRTLTPAPPTHGAALPQSAPASYSSKEPPVHVNAAMPMGCHQTAATAISAAPYMDWFSIIPQKIQGLPSWITYSGPGPSTQAVSEACAAGAACDSQDKHYGKTWQQQQQQQNAAATIPASKQKFSAGQKCTHEWDGCDPLQMAAVAAASAAAASASYAAALAVAAEATVNAVTCPVQGVQPVSSIADATRRTFKPCSSDSSSLMHSVHSTAVASAHSEYASASERTHVAGQDEDEVTSVFNSTAHHTSAVYANVHARTPAECSSASQYSQEHAQTTQAAAPAAPAESGCGSVSHYTLQTACDEEEVMSRQQQPAKKKPGKLKRLVHKVKKVLGLVTGPLEAPPTAYSKGTHKPQAATVEVQAGAAPATASIGQAGSASRSQAAAVQDAYHRPVTRSQAAAYAVGMLPVEKEAVPAPANQMQQMMLDDEVPKQQTLPPPKVWDEDLQKVPSHSGIHTRSQSKAVGTQLAGQQQLLSGFTTRTVSASCEELHVKHTGYPASSSHRCSSSCVAKTATETTTVPDGVVAHRPKSVGVTQGMLMAATPAPRGRSAKQVTAKQTMPRASQVIVIDLTSDAEDNDDAVTSSIKPSSSNSKAAHAMQASAAAAAASSKAQSTAAFGGSHAQQWHDAQQCNSDMAGASAKPAPQAGGKNHKNASGAAIVASLATNPVVEQGHAHQVHAAHAAPHLTAFTQPCLTASGTADSTTGMKLRDEAFGATLRQSASQLLGVIKAAKAQRRPAMHPTVAQLQHWDARKLRQQIREDVPHTHDLLFAGWCQHWIEVDRNFSRTARHQIPRCPGLYEWAARPPGAPAGSTPIPFYMGKAGQLRGGNESLRSRFNAYEPTAFTRYVGPSREREKYYFWKELQRRGFTLYYRWRECHDVEPEKLESWLLERLDYAANVVKNGCRRQLKLPGGRTLDQYQIL